MSGETETTTLTHEQALAANDGGASPEELAAATSAANASAAPASANDQAMLAFSKTLDEIKAALGIGEEVTSIVGPAVGLVSPAGMSVMSRVAELESVVTDLLSSIKQHFGGKVPTPEPPTTQNQPVFKPAVPVT